MQFQQEAGKRAAWASAQQANMTTTQHWFGPFWFSAAIVLIGGIIFLGYPVLQDLAIYLQRSDTSDPPALLQVDQQGTDLRIHWNRGLQALRQANSGMLSITDGNNSPRLVRLDADQLRTGSLLYSPASNQVQFRLELREPDGRNVSESVLALNAVRTPAPGSQTPAVTTAPQTTALQAVVPRPAPSPTSDVTHAPVTTHAVAGDPVSSRATAAASAPAKTNPDRPAMMPPSLKALVNSQTPAGALVPGELVDKVSPQVSQKARDTIQGTVRVRVRVHVDASGNVLGAELESAGPSRYFAERALEAARRCRFTPAIVDGREVESQWTVRFEFARTGTKLVPARISP